MICVAETTVNVALAPPNVTAVAPVKSVPVIVTDVPTGPEVAVNELTAGADSGAEESGDVTVNVAELEAVPAGVVTETTPVVA